MTLVFINKNSVPNYIAVSTDIVNSTIDGISMVGGTVYTSDDSQWYVIKNDLTLSTYALPITLSGQVNVGAVSQGAASLVENWRVNVTNTVGLTDTELRASPVEVSGTVATGALTDAELRASPVEVTTTISNVISTLNSTETHLLSGETFNGTFEELMRFENVSVLSHSDVSSAPSGLIVEWSTDGITVCDSDFFTITGGAGKQFSFGVTTKYVRVRYINGTEPQSEFHLQTIFHTGTPKPSSHRIDDVIVPEDDAELMKAVITARTPDGGYKNIRASQGGVLFVGIDDFQSDAGGRVRTASLVTLGDYKILGYDRENKWESVGTGTGLYFANKFSLSVTSGQYYIRQTRRFHPYFSGKSQIVEETFYGFSPQTNLIKRIGYFSSNAVAPYASTFDGFWIESANGTIRLKSSRAGTETLSVALEDMSGYNNLGEYKNLATWDNFTVVMFDFLWLGGAVLRLWVKTSSGFVLAHQFDYAGTAQDVFILSPNQPLRYEIVSTGGSGTLYYVCAQVATEGSVNESGSSRFVDTGSTLITTATSGTTYPIKAIRKQTSMREVGVLIDNLDSLVGSANDQAIWSLQINPTFSAPLTFVDLGLSPIQEATGNGTITVTTPGIKISGGSVESGSALNLAQLSLNYLAWVGSSIDNTMDIYTLCITPISGSMTVYGGIGFKIY